MAGDGEGTETFNLTDLALLAFAEEAGHFDEELAAAFGPEEAHRIAFSPELCFSQSIYETPAPTSTAPRQ